MVKTYIIDTNVLLHDPNSLMSFKDNIVVIPMIVLEELDKKKDGNCDVARNARTVIRTLDDLRSGGNLSDGVKTIDGGTIKVEVNFHDKIPSDMDKTRADNKILAVVLETIKMSNTEVILVTKDINLRVKGDAFGIKSEDYRTDRVADKADEIYSGFSELLVDEAILSNLNEFGFVSLPYSDFFENQYVMLKTGKEKQNALTKVRGGSLIKINSCGDVWGIGPKNKEQACAFDALFDPSINLVTLLGKSGCGKTLLAVASGISQVLDTHKYKKLILTRPVEPLGGRGKESQDMGFLPGTVMEKMMPILMPFFDNLDLLFGDRGKGMVEQYMDAGTICIEPLAYIRGRSLSGPSIIIVDECQNLSPKSIKTILTRVGFGSKIILTGDIHQIDSVYLDAVNNGLAYVVEKFKGQKMAGTITFSKGERSDLATLASEIL